MAKTRIVVPGTVGRSVRIPASATEPGATIGQNLKMPDGSPATAGALLAFLGIKPTKPGPAAPGTSVSLWSLIQEVPNNVVDVASLTDMQTNDAIQFDGTALTNTRTGPHYLVQNDPLHFWTLEDFVRGTNIIGVRVAGHATVFIPHEVPIEQVIGVKAESAAGTVTVKIY